MFRCFICEFTVVYVTYFYFSEYNYQNAFALLSKDRNGELLKIIYYNFCNEYRVYVTC